MPVQFHQIKVRKKRGDRRPCHYAALFVEKHAIFYGFIRCKQARKERIERRIIRKHFPKDGEQACNINAVEIIRNIKLVAIVFRDALRVRQRADCVMCAARAAKGITACRHAAIIAVQQICHEFKHAAFLRAKLIYDALFIRTGFVDAALLRRIKAEICLSHAHSKRTKCAAVNKAFPFFQLARRQMAFFYLVCEKCAPNAHILKHINKAHAFLL